MQWSFCKLATGENKRLTEKRETEKRMMWRESWIKEGPSCLICDNLIGKGKAPFITGREKEIQKVLLNTISQKYVEYFYKSTVLRLIFIFKSLSLDPGRANAHKSVFRKLFLNSK